MLKRIDIDTAHWLVAHTLWDRKISTYYHYSHDVALSRCDTIASKHRSTHRPLCVVADAKMCCSLYRLLSTLPSERFAWHSHAIHPLPSHPTVVPVFGEIMSEVQCRLKTVKPQIGIVLKVKIRYPHSASSPNTHTQTTLHRLTDSLGSIVMTNRFDFAHKFYCRHENVVSALHCLRSIVLWLFFRCTWKLAPDKPPKYVFDGFSCVHLEQFQWKKCI